VSIARSAEAKLLLLVLLVFPVSALVLAQEQQAQQTQQPTPAQPAPAGQEQQQQAQESEPPPDVIYTPEEYAVYDKAVKEPDPATREDAIIAFIKANPKSSLVNYGISSYLELMQQYMSEGNMQKLVVA